MAKLGLGRTKSLHLKSTPRESQHPFVPDLNVLENRLVRVGTPNFSRTAKLPDFVTAAGHDQDSPIRPQTANAAMDRRKELMAMGSPIVLTSGRDIFNFPTPSRSPSTTQDMYVPELRSDTPDTIGVALGSPSHVAFFQSPMFESPYQNSLLAVPKDVIIPPLSTPGRSMTSYESRNTKNDLNEGVKPKLSRWRSLGGLFGRKQAQARQDRKPSVVQPIPRQERRPLPLVQQTSPAPVDLKLHGVHTWERDNSSKVVFEAQSSPQSAKKTRRERMGIGRAQTAPTGGRRVESPAPPPKGPMLDVQIPDTKMERYSVMFNQTPTHTPEPESPPFGLLARRQASMSRKRADSSQTLELPLPPRIRNTDTPELSPGYTLRLFPVERTHSPKPPAQIPHISTMHRPRPLKRSNTAPGALSPGLKDKHSPTPLATMAEVVEDLMEEDIRQALTPTPSEPSTPTTPSDSHTLHSFRTLAGNRASTATTWDPSLTEPSWQMITIGKMVEPGDRFSDAARFAASNVRVRSNSDQKDEDWHHDGEAGVVQIARSMSVTKAKRQIIGPRRVDGKRPQVQRLEGQQVVGPHKVELVRKDGGTERFVERKPLTPNLVQMVEMPTGANRKSVRVILEDA